MEFAVILTVCVAVGIFKLAIFDWVRKNQPESLKKLVPIQGDVTQSELGISQLDQKTLIDNISIVFHSAATVKFDEALKLSVAMNLLGTQRLVHLCYKMTKLEENELEIDENEEVTDYLPQNWFQYNIMYKSRYMCNKQLFLLHGFKTGDIFIFNFYNVMTKQVSTTSFGDINTTVQMMNDMAHNSVEKNKFNLIVDLLEKDLIKSMKLKNGVKKVVSSQTETRTSKLSSKTLSEEVEKYFSRRMANSDLRRNSPPDLDPLGRNYPGSGVLLCDPPRVLQFPTRNPLAWYNQINPRFAVDYEYHPHINPQYPDSLRQPNYDGGMNM